MKLIKYSILKPSQPSFILIVINMNNMPPVLQTGFRIFFLGAIFYAILATLIWTMQLYSHWGIELQTISRAQWHGHEMIFGYTMAVIAGFLLTAVQNWTGEKSVNGRQLLLLFLFWAITRVLALFPVSSTLPLILISSTIFHSWLIIAIYRPIRLSANKKQGFIIATLIMLWLLDFIFIVSAYGQLPQSYASNSLLLSVYIVIGLVLFMAQRVMPFFIRNAIKNKGNVYNKPLFSSLSLLFFLLFISADVLQWQTILIVSGLSFSTVTLVQLWCWHDVEIWQKPLLWVLFVPLLFIIIGVFIRSVAYFIHIMPSLGLHAMTFGGIGIISIGMLSRVSLGHTGRNVFKPPEWLGLIFTLMVVGAIIRSLLPLIFIEYYFFLILISQVLWICAFIMMLILFYSPLIQTRVDNKFG